MDEIPQLLPHSPQSTRSVMISSSPIRQSPHRLSSPSKTRGTPSKTRQNSPIKSPAKNRVFQSVSTKSVSFTPEKTRQPPRAWERRPATPFIPRDDKQKIWKRVPLGELGIEQNRPVSISKKDQESTKDYMRIIKKLKTDHCDDEDKENMSIGAKIETDDKHGKRRVRFDSRFVTMKMEEDVIAGSPKKKLRAPQVENHSSTAEDIISENEDATEEEEYEIEQEDDGPHIAVEDVNVQGSGKNQGTPTDQGNTPRDDADLTAEGVAGSIQGSADFARPCSDETSTVDDVTKPTSVKSTDSPLTRRVVITETTGSSAVEIVGAVDSEFVMSDTHTSGKTITDTQDLPAQTVELNEPFTTVKQSHDEMDEEENESPAITPEEPRSSSPPTILAENVVIDELESRTISKPEMSTEDQGTSSDSQTAAQTSASLKESEPISRRVSDDEAAFLRNFVTTTKAERAARDKKLQELPSDNHTEHFEASPESSVDVAEKEEGSEPIQPMPMLEASVLDQPDALSGSPLRRSKRATITSIPRPQNLPNAIQLKRANGNEFIFTANKASSAANVAVVTRSNTKRNKGSALAVPARLEQLISGEQNTGLNEDYAQGSEAPCEGISKTEGKKRKREAKNGGGRAKKVLRWNDEKLVSYQEAEETMDGWEAIETSSQELSSSQDVQHSESEKQVRLTLSLTMTGPATQTSDEKSTSGLASTPSQNRVRRVRRGTSGSVNGTPGPKTRSRRVAMEDETEDKEKEINLQVPIDTNGSVEDSSAAITAINTLAASSEISKTGAAKKSRMPMPVSSSARRGAAASASIRTAGTAATRFNTPAGLAETKKGDSGKAKEADKATTQKDEARGDVLGKRRLRVRS